MLSFASDRRISSTEVSNVSAGRNASLVQRPGGRRHPYGPGSFSRSEPSVEPRPGAPVATVAVAESAAADGESVTARSTSTAMLVVTGVDSSVSPQLATRTAPATAKFTKRTATIQLAFPRHGITCLRPHRTDRRDSFTYTTDRLLSLADEGFVPVGTMNEAMSAAEVSTSNDLAAIFSREVRSIFGFLEYRTGNRAVAEDLTAQTFEAASEQFEAGRGGDVTSAWLRTVARRRLVDHWRSAGAQRRRHTRLIMEFRESSPPPDDPESDVDEALASLSANQRAVLVLRYVDDLSVSEVAETMGLTYKAAESLLARARRSFADAYDLGATSGAGANRWAE